MLLVGDKIKQVKEINGFNFVGGEFTVTGFEKSLIMFKSSFGRGVMTLKEFNEHFEKVEYSTYWTDWISVPNSINLVYRVKGRTVSVMNIETEDVVYAKALEDDTYDLDTGIQICKIKLEIIYQKRAMKQMRKELNELNKQLHSF